MRQLLDYVQILLLVLAHACAILIRTSSLQIGLLEVCRLVRVGCVILLGRVFALILLIPFHDGRLRLYSWELSRQTPQTTMVSVDAKQVPELAIGATSYCICFNARR